MMYDREYATDDGALVRCSFNQRGAVCASDNWSALWTLVREGKFCTENYGPATYGHTDFFAVEG